MPLYRTGFEIGVNARPFHGEIELFVIQWKDGDRRMELRPFGIVRQAQGEYIKDFQFVEYASGETARPAFTLHDDAARQLMDGLWRAGVRPSEGVDNAGQLKATERHLADMRKIVEAKLNISLEPPLKFG